MMNNNEPDVEPDVEPDAEFDVDLDAELHATDGLFAAAFAHLGDLPADLEQRARRGASATMMDRSLIGIAVDLMSVGVDTLRLLGGNGTGGSRP